MSELDYKPNSYKYREKLEGQSEEKPEERKPLQKVVTGKVKTQKKSGFHKLADIFVSEEARNVKSYVLLDVLVPAIKDAIEDIVTNGIHMILRGEASPTRRNSSISSKASYTPYYNASKNDRFSNSVNQSRAANNYSLDEITLASKSDAEEVINQLCMVIKDYGVARVADLYESLGITGNFTDNKYGWTNLRNAEIVRVRDGYLLRLPRPMPID